MIPLPASAVLAGLAVAERRVTLAVLGDLAEPERALARELLTALPDGSRIDLPAFVADVRRRARVTAETATDVRAAIMARLDRIAAVLRRDAAEPELAPQQRRGVPRVRRSRPGESQSGLGQLPGTLAARPAQRPPARPAGRPFGGRGFVGAEDATPDPGQGFGRPPWLLDDPADADPLPDPDLEDNAA